MSLFDLPKKVAIITQSSRGEVKAIAEDFVARANDREESIGQIDPVRRGAPIVPTIAFVVFDEASYLSSQAFGRRADQLHVTSRGFRN